MGAHNLARRGGPPRVKLARELPRIFWRTLGAWAAGEREDEVKRMFPAPTTGPGKEGDSEDSEEDVEEGDDRVLQALRQTQSRPDEDSSSEDDEEGDRSCGSGR